MLEKLELSEGPEPVYRRLADSVAARIAAGELAAGDRLPPQREMARALGINVTTVTRALSILQKRGLVEARPGRGTLVSARSGGDRIEFASAPSDVSGLIDLSVNRPPTTAYLDELSLLLPRLARDPRYATLQDYHPAEGPVWARAAIGTWLKGVAGSGLTEQIVLAAGAQHALDGVLGAIARRGEVVLSDEVTYQGVSALCRMHGLDLVGVAMDRGGMLPDAFERACVQLRPRAVFLMPTLHNPTTITLAPERRRALAAVARHHNVFIVEDDVYRPLVRDPPASFAELEPELTIHIGGLSKCLAPGLRFGFAIAPRTVAGQIAAALRVKCWSISPMTALVATRLAEDGAIDRILSAQQQELEHRQAVLSEILGRFGVHGHPTSTHAWLPLSEPWRGADFASACLRKGVVVLPGNAFAVGREPTQHGVRINVGAARSRDDLQKALSVMADLLNTGSLQVGSFI